MSRSARRASPSSASAAWGPSLPKCSSAAVGKLLLYDYDTVELANMNRLFFRPDQKGLFKVKAAEQTLKLVNPYVEVVPYCYNITLASAYDGFVRELMTGGVLFTTADNKAPPPPPVDLVLCCVDNFQARLAINLVCLENNIPWFESGVSENAVSGHIQLLLPGVSPCYECCPPLIVATAGMHTGARGRSDYSTTTGGGGDGHGDIFTGQRIKRQEEEAPAVPSSSSLSPSSSKSSSAASASAAYCAASLPTTMGIIAGFMAQNALKYLLEFGHVSEYIGYDAMKDHFPRIAIRPNPECANRVCLQRQREFSAKVDALEKEMLLRNNNNKGADAVREETMEAAHPLYRKRRQEKEAEQRRIEDGKKRAKAAAEEWGIEVTAEGGDNCNLGGGDATASVATAFEYAFAPPTEQNVTSTNTTGKGTETAPEEESLEQLMARLKGLQ